MIYLLSSESKSPRTLEARGAFMCLSTLHGHRLLSLYRIFRLAQFHFSVNVFVAFPAKVAGRAFVNRTSMVRLSSYGLSASIPNAFNIIRCCGQYLEGSRISGVGSKAPWGRGLIVFAGAKTSQGIKPWDRMTAVWLDWLSLGFEPCLYLHLSFNCCWVNLNARHWSLSAFTDV